MYSLSYSTYKPKAPLTNDLCTGSEQLSLEETDGMYCSLCNMHHVHSQNMSPDGKDICQSSLSSKNNRGEHKYLKYRAFLYMYVTFCNSHIGHHSLGKRSIISHSEVSSKV